MVRPNIENVEGFALESILNQNENYAGGVPARRILNPSWRKRQPYGSTMTIQVWLRHSPFKVVADALFF
jgi:hypothetical protein